MEEARSRAPVFEVALWHLVLDVRPQVTPECPSG